MEKNVAEIEKFSFGSVIDITVIGLSLTLGKKMNFVFFNFQMKSTKSVLSLF